MNKNLRERLTHVLAYDLMAIKWFMGWTALLTGIGFLFFSADLSSYKLMTLTQPLWIWAVIFILFGIIRLLGCLYRVPFLIKLGSPIIGMYIWTYLFISKVIFDTSAFEVTELLSMQPVLCELWIFIQALAKYKGLIVFPRRELDA